VATVSRGKGFELGQEDYRKGDGGYKDAGSPVLYLRFGSTERRYLVPEWQAGQWQHFAIVRKDDKVRLYVNGELRLPFAILKPRVLGIGIAKSTSRVYTWFAGARPPCSGGAGAGQCRGNRPTGRPAHSASAAST
jgi:hypothetical protein